jgi:hypothetical protein
VKMCPTGRQSRRLAARSRPPGGLFRIIVVCVLSLVCRPSSAQIFDKVDDTSTLRQIVIFGRHGVRAPIVPYNQIETFAARSYPSFDVPVAYLTPHGVKAEVLLGSYFRTIC